MLERTTSFAKSLIRSELFRNTTVLISGTTISQLIPILLQPILRRSFSIEMFGAYSVYISIIGILVIVCSFKYDVPIVLSSNDKNAVNIFFLSVIINLVFNLSLFVAIALFKSRIAHFINLKDNYSNYLFFVPLGTFLMGIYQSINNWLLRKKLYYSLTLNKFIRRGLEGTVQLGLKFVKFPHFLLYGDIAGHISNVISGINQLFKNGFLIRQFSPHRIRYVLKKYDEYPKYNLLPAFMTACSTLLPAIFINKFYSLEVAGYMDLSRMLLMVPVALVSLSLSSVLLQRTSEKYRGNLSIVKELRMILLALVGFGVIEVALITLFGESIFKIFGKEWAFSGTISKITVWSFALTFIVNSFYSLFISLNRIKLLSIWQVYYFLSIMSLVFFRNYAFLDFVKIYVVLESVCTLIMAFMLIRIVSDYEKKITSIVA